MGIPFIPLAKVRQQHCVLRHTTKYIILRRMKPAPQIDESRRVSRLVS